MRSRPTLHASLGLLLGAACLLSLPSMALAQEHDEVRFKSYRAHLAAAAAALREHDVTTALEWLDDAPARFAGWELDALRSMSDDSRAVWEGHEGAVLAVAWSPDGKRVVSAGVDGKLHVRDAQGTTLRILDADGGEPRAVAWDLRGERVACAYSEGALDAWDVTNGKRLWRWNPETAKSQLNRTPRGIVWAPDGTRLAMARPGRVVVHAAVDGELLQQIEGSRPWPLACSAHFSADGSRLLAFFWDGLLQTRNTADWSLVETRDPPEGFRGFHAYHDLRFSPDGTSLAAAGFDGSVRVHRVGTGENLEGQSGHKRKCYTVAFSRDGDRFASGYVDGSVRLWDARTAELLATWIGHRAAVHGLSFSPDGATIVSASADGSLRTWDAATLGGARAVVMAKDAVWSAPFSHDGRLLATADSKGLITLWDLETRSARRVFKPFESEATSIAFTPDGTRLIASSNQKMVRVFDLDADDPVAELEGHERGIPNIALDPTGRVAASASYDGTLRIWDLDTKTCSHVLRLDVYDCAFSPDGTRLATNDGKAVVIVDVASGEEVARFTEPAHTRSVAGVAWSPDGKLVASGCLAGSLRLWEVDGGRARLAVRGHTDALYGIAFHPDGNRFATAGYDAAVRIWSPDLPRALCTFADLRDKAYAIDFSRDGHKLAVSTIDGAVTLWDTSDTRPAAGK